LRISRAYEIKRKCLIGGWYQRERDAMIAHGNSAVLDERLNKMSDPYRVRICNDKCGMIANNTKECKACKSNKIEIMNLPYSAKLLTQELMAMGIKVKYSVNG
jgi:DNA-directed RNA polymerase II subunit RPB2